MEVKEFEQQAWSLDDLYSALDSPKVEETLEDVEEKVQVFEGYREALEASPSTDRFVEILEAYESLSRTLSKLQGYGYLAFSSDTQDQAAQAFRARVEQLGAEADNRTMFFKLWWKGLSEEEAAPFLEVSGDYRYWLEALRLQKPFTLSEPEERIINLKDVNGSSAMVTLYDSITNRYTFELEVEGEVKKLTRGELSVFFRSPEPELRKQAYQELYRVYEGDLPILGQIYQYRARDWFSEYVKLRDYPAPISVRNLSNDIPDEVVDTLLQVCQENTGLFHRFFKLKAEWLGVDKLRRYDIYAPVVETEKTYKFNQSVQLVMDSLGDFDSQIRDLALRVLKEDHLDSEVRPGKMGGAYCLTVTPDLTPWVLQNYQGRPDDVATMAHELGHAIHSMMAQDHTALTQHPSLPLAETASTFSEMLLIDTMLEEDPDPAVQRDLLFRQMDDAYATIMRQAFFAIFEKDAHQTIQEGTIVDDLSGLYMENLERQFGKSLDLSDDFQYEWVAIPHFYHYPFYVYAYAFGQLLVLSLYQQYQEEGDAFKPRYKEILAAGGSASPIEILKDAGIEVSSADFWQGGFNVIESALERLEGLEITT